MTTDNKSAGVVIQEYDAIGQKLLGPVYKIFDGTELAKTEAPHIYYFGGFYYLITAEGGTGTGHAVTICRAKEITGPYELDPQYPMLTARDKPESPLQCSGHGSIVQTSMGNWYMVYLCTRPLLGKAAILGRETSIQEVYWTEDGWLRLMDGGNGPLVETEIITADQVEQRKNTNFKDDFNGALDKEWNSLRILAEDSWCDLKSRKGYLRLFSGDSIHSLFKNHILAIRQKDFRFHAATKVDYSPKTYNQMAGILLYLNDNNYLYAYLTHDEASGRVIRLFQCKEGRFTLFPVIIQVEDREVELKVEVDGTVAQFYYRMDREALWKAIGEPQDVTFLSGGFTGNFVGIGVHDMDRKAGSYADFSFFEYSGLDPQ